MGDDFQGIYPSWEDAMEVATGYGAPEILEKAKIAVQKIKSGEAVFERDTILYDEPHYSYPVISYLLYAASAGNNRLRVLDFGGSLGSLYFQCRPFLDGLAELSWNVVEQPGFVEYGRSHVAEGPLSFYHTIEECMAEEKPDVLLLSGILQLLKDPYDFLSRVFAHRFKYIIIDRTPMTQEEHFLSVQFVSPEIYDASYPSWFFNQDEFMNFLETEYEILDYFDSFESWVVEGIHAQNMGFLLQRRDWD
ncbi:MAG TPA: methyltransferase, TIGR04325 family [Bacilli bacterium]